MDKKKTERTAAEILQDINELMGLINIDGAWYANMESYNEIQAKKPARVARRALLAAIQKNK